MIALLLLFAPPLPVIVSVTVLPAALLFVCDGFCTELCAEPSPKFQSQAVIVPVDWSVNCTVNGACPEVGLAVKLAAGGGGGAATTMMIVLLLLGSPTLEAVSSMMESPALL